MEAIFSKILIASSRSNKILIAQLDWEIPGERQISDPEDDVGIDKPWSSTTMPELKGFMTPQ